MIKQQTYIGYDENNELFECAKVFSGKVSNEKPYWVKEIEDKNEKSKWMGNNEE